MKALAMTQYEQRKYIEAEKTQKVASEVANSLFGPKHELTLDSMQNLASLYIGTVKREE